MVLLYRRAIRVSRPQTRKGLTEIFMSLLAKMIFVAMMFIALSTIHLFDNEKKTMIVASMD